MRFGDKDREIGTGIGAVIGMYEDNKRTFFFISKKMKTNDAVYLKSVMQNFVYESSIFILDVLNVFNMSRLVGKPTMWFTNRYDTNWPVQAQKIARSLKFRI